MLRVEIRPGFFINVKERRKVQDTATLLFRTDISDSERRNIMETIARKKVYFRKYTATQLKDAAELARQIGIRKASEASGVKYWSVVGQLRLDAIAGVYKPKHSGCRGKYTPEQKRACVTMAQQIATDGVTTMAEAFAKAGQRLGVNGRTVAQQYSQGMIKLK